MAEHKKYEDIKFYYISTNPIDKLCEELINYCEYQKVIFIGFNENEKTNIKQKLKNELFLQFSNDLTDVEFNKQIYCVVCKNDSNLDLCKNLTNKYDINIILYIDKYVILEKFYNFKNGNATKLLGCIIDKNEILKNDFKSNFLINLPILYFYCLEVYFNRMFFNNKKVSINSSLLKDIDDILLNYNEFEQLKDDILLDLYYKVSIFFMDKNFSICDFLCKNYNFDNYFKVNYIKTVVIEILLNCYKLFLSKINPNIVNFIRIENKCNNNKKCLVKLNCFSKQFDLGKFWFVNKNFNQIFISIIDDYLMSIKKLKQLSLKDNINKNYSSIKNIKIDDFKNMLSNNIELFNDDSFAKIIDYFGYFDF